MIYWCQTPIGRYQRQRPIKGSSATDPIEPTCIEFNIINNFVRQSFNFFEIFRIFGRDFETKLVPSGKKLFATIRTSSNLWKERYQVKRSYMKRVRGFSLSRNKPELEVQFQFYFDYDILIQALYLLGQSHI